MQNKFIIAVLIGVIAIGIIGGVMVGYYVGYDHGWEHAQKPIIDDDNDNNGVACTEEAMQCPDGSYVGRTGPKCEFAQCPTNGNGGVVQGQEGISGVVLLGPLCPVVREGEECPDKQFATNLVLTTIDGARVVKTFSSDVNGKFKISVSKGEYTIRSGAVSHMLPYCNSEVIKVISGMYTNITVHCDTGIR